MKARKVVPFATLLCCLALVAGCESITEPSAVDAGQAGLEMAIVAQEAAFGADVRRDLAAARAASAKYHRFDLAEPDGYVLPPDSHCAESPMGGMGYHYVNFGLVGPPEVLDASKPQVLLYEPQKNGRMKLVAVEWIVPWAIVPADAPAPTFMGQTFNPNPGLELWMLHAWIWEHNPDGIFADWNPRISCQHAEH